MMKAAVMFTGSGALLVVTSHDSFKDSRVLEALNSKGIHKFIAFEVPLNMVKEKYGTHFSVALGDLKQRDDLRVVDEEGRRVFYNFPMEAYGEMTCHEEAVHLKEVA